MLTFIADTREYVWGGLRNEDRPSGQQIGDHLRSAHAALPPGVKQTYGRVDAGFHKAEWKPSPKTDAEEECEFDYQPEGWSQH